MRTAVLCLDASNSAFR